jgi:hypothetical protein
MPSNNDDHAERDAVHLLSVRSPKLEQSLPAFLPPGLHACFGAR